MLDFVFYQKNVEKSEAFTTLFMNLYLIRFEYMFWSKKYECDKETNTYCIIFNFIILLGKEMYYDFQQENNYFILHVFFKDLEWEVSSLGFFIFIWKAILVAMK